MHIAYIGGYRGLYSITTDGTITSHFNGFNKTFRDRVMKQSSDRNGYKIVRLTNNGRSRVFYVHRLIALSFIPNPLSKPFINHIDGNKANNKINNLEWCTQAENNKHAYATGLQKHRPANMVAMREKAKAHTRQPIEAYCYLTNKFLWRTDSLVEAKHLYGIDPSSVCCVLRGKYKFHKDMYFKRV